MENNDPIVQIIIKAVNMTEQGMDPEAVQSNIKTLCERAKLDEDAPKYIWIAVKRLIENRKNTKTRPRSDE